MPEDNSYNLYRDLYMEEQASHFHTQEILNEMVLTVEDLMAQRQATQEILNEATSTIERLLAERQTAVSTILRLLRELRDLRPAIASLYDPPVKSPSLSDAPVNHSKPNDYAEWRSRRPSDSQP